MLNPNPRLPELEYIKPDSLKSAVNFLKDTASQSVPYLGGTDCFIALRDKKLLPKYLVDLKHLNGFTSLAFDDQNGLSIGAAVTLNQMIESDAVQTHYPILAQAAQAVGGYQLRNRATVVGNLCNASPCGDTIGPCMVYQGDASVVGPEGSNSVGLAHFFTGPGETILEAGNIVQSIHLPPPPAQSRGRYLSIGRNKLADLAIVAVTVLAFPDLTVGSGFRFRIALSAVAPTVIFVDQAQALLSESPINPSALEKAAQIARRTCKPIDDIRASARYRRDMVHALTLRALQDVWHELLNE